MCIPTILKLKMFAAIFSTACLRTPPIHVMNSETVYTAESYIYTITSSEVIPVHTNRPEKAYHMTVKYAGLVNVMQCKQKAEGWLLLCRKTTQEEQQQSIIC